MDVMKLFRTLLFVPGSKPEWIAKSADYGADVVILDLEDSVPPQLKAEARSHVAAAIPALQKKGQRVYVRINRDGGPDEEDLKAVVLPELEGLVIPKPYGPEDVKKINEYLTQIEQENGVEPGSIALIPTLETARSMMLAYEIACCERVVAIVAVHAKNGDGAREIGFQWTPEGLETLYIRSKVVLAARAASVRPLVGVWQDVHDLDGLKKSAQTVFTAPVRIGDTLRGETEVINKRESKKYPNAGIVWFEHRGYNQRDDLVVRSRRVGLMLKKRTLSVSLMKR